MKHIKQYMLAIVSLILFTACSSDEKEEEYQPTSVRQNVTFQAGSQLQQTVTLDGLTSAIADVGNTDAWVTSITPLAYSGSGSPKVIINVSENTAQAARSCTVTFKDVKGNTVIMTISQAGLSEPAYEPKHFTMSVSMSSEAGEKALVLTDLKTDISDIGSPTENWLTAVKQVYANGAPSVTLTVTENPNQSERTAQLTITAVNGDDVLLTVKQHGKDTPPQPQNYTQTTNVEADGGTKTVTLNNLSTAIASISSDAEWAQATKRSYTSGSPSIDLTVEANAATTERECVITITATNDDKVQLTVKQAGRVYGIDDTHDSTTDKPAYTPLRK